MTHPHTPAPGEQTGNDRSSHRRTVVVPQTERDDLPHANDVARGSFAGLVGAIEQRNVRRGAKVRVSTAAYEGGMLVRRMRKGAGLSQRDLATRLDISQARISEIESGIGARGPTWELMSRIANACGWHLTAEQVGTARELTLVEG